MHRLNEIASKLTPAEVKEVEDFAEFLVARKATPQADSTKAKRSSINVDALIGLCKGMGGDMSDKELIRDAWDHAIKKYD